MEGIKSGRWLRVGAYVLLGLAAAFWLLTGVGEIAGGDLSGASHLVPTALAMGLLYVAIRNPPVGGLCLAALGVAASVFFYQVINRPGFRFVGVALGGGPFLVSGLLLLIAVALGRLPRPGRKLG